MPYKQEIAMLELRGDRLILIQKFGNMKASQVEVDVTGVWHFFKDYLEYLSTPSFPDTLGTGKE